MSYDIRFAVRGEPEGRYYVVFEPDEYAHPTYNLGTLFRTCMAWDFRQGEWYRVSEIMHRIERGISELQEHSERYAVYEPDNGWGTMDGAIRCLKDIVKTVRLQLGGWDWNDYELEYLWMSW